MAILTVVRGLPGSGKTTYAKKNFNCLVLEQDMYHERDGKYSWSAGNMERAVDWCRNMAALALSRGMDVCVVNTFTRKRYVEEYRKLAESRGAKFEVFRMLGNYGNVHSVPPAVLAAMEKGFEEWPGEKTVPPA